MEFSLHAIKRIFNSEVGLRIGNDAKNELRKELNILGEDISREAVKIADSEGRITVRKSDIREAVKRLDN